MKKHLRNSLALFFASVLVTNLHRPFTSGEMIFPFPLEPEIKISIAWYAKMICDLVATMLFTMCICAVLSPVEKHLKEVTWVGHNAMYVFVKVWHRIFFIVAVVNGLDLLHFMISFRQTNWFFLIQNGFFFIMTSYYLYKAYRK